MKVSDDVKKVSSRAAWFGVVLALVCHLVPQEYRAVCDLVADICQGRF